MSAATQVKCPHWCRSGFSPCQGEHFANVGAVRTTGAEITRRFESPDDYPVVSVTIGFCEHPSEIPDDEPYVTVGICDEVTERDLPLRASEALDLIALLAQAVTTIKATE